MNDNKLLNFTDIGQGEITLVFLHYFGGSSATWKKVITELCGDFRCVAIDLPGFGNSHNEEDDLSVCTCAAKVGEVIIALALEKFIIVGHSMGGKIALFFASGQPPGLASLILVAPSPPTPEPMSDNDRQDLLKAYGDRFALGTLADNITNQTLTEADTESVITDNLKASYASWNWWVTQGSREDIADKMSTVNVPVVIISGEYDLPLSTNFLKKEMSRYFPSTSFSEIKGAKHLIPVEAPAALAESIKEYSSLN